MSEFGPIFGVGCPRSGTTTFAAQMGQKPGVQSLHEGITVSGRQAVIKPEYRYLIQSEECTPAESAWNEAGLRCRLDYARSIAPTTMSESNNSLSFNLPAIERMFPDATIIHLVRRPEEFVVSQLRCILAAFPGTTAMAKPSERRNRWAGYGDSAVWFPHDTHVERLARVWQLLNETVERTKLKRLAVQTDDLASEETWRKINDICGLCGTIPDLNIRANTGPQVEPSTEIVDACERYCTWRAG